MTDIYNEPYNDRNFVGKEIKYFILLIKIEDNIIFNP